MEVVGLGRGELKLSEIGTELFLMGVKSRLEGDVLEVVAPTVSSGRVVEM
jgi:hypothetical protein